MARVLAIVLTAFTFLLADAVDSEADRPRGARRRAPEREHPKASLVASAVDSEADRPKGARRRAREREHTKASLLDGSVHSEADRPQGARRRAHEREHTKASPVAAAVEPEADRPRGARRRAHEREHTKASLLDGSVESEADRPKGARRRARERALARASAEEVAKTGCINLGGDKRFVVDGHDETIQVFQHRCWITFSLSDAQLHRGVVRGYKVHVEPPFADGEILPNQTIAFEDGKRWVRKF